MRWCRGQGRSERQIRRWHSLRNVERNGEGKVIRSNRTGAVKSQGAFLERDKKRAIAEERKI
eukprot:9481616-Pyramimonas_sp.AAC.2